MRGAISLPFVPDAVALCNLSTVALFDHQAKKLSLWTKTEEYGLEKVNPLLPIAFQGSSALSKSKWSIWNMAENAAVVCALNDFGHLCVLLPDQYEEYPHISAQRITQVNAEGKWAYLQSRQDTLKVDLKTGKVLDTMRLTTMVNEQKNAKTWICAGQLFVTQDNVTIQTTLSSTTWIPTLVTMGENNTVYVLNVSRKNKEFFTQIHAWKITEQQLRCTKTVTFEDPCYEFKPIGTQEKWCCLWPKKKGYVVQDADGYGNSITCAFSPVGFETLIAYQTPQDRSRLILVQV